MNHKGHETGPHPGIAETQTKPEVTEAQETKSRIKNQLADILTDRAGFHIAPELRTIPDSLENLQIPEILSPTAEENLRILSMLSGHSGGKFRKLLNGNSPLANHLRTLFDWSKDAATGKNTSLETLNTEIPELLQNQTPDEIYERTTFLDLYPETGTTEEEYKQDLILKVGEAVGKKLNPKKWYPETATALTKEDLTTEQLQKVIEQVGFIPRVIYSTKKFQDIEAPRITSLITRLREIEGSSEEERGLVESEEQATFTKKKKIKQRANTERARLINTLLTSPQSDHLRRKKPPLTLEIDANGLFIQGENFGSHLPYGLIEAKTLKALEEPKPDTPELLNKHALLEAKVRKAVQNGNYTEYFPLCLEQMLEYARELEWSEEKIRRFFSQRSPEYSHSMLGRIHREGQFSGGTSEAEHINERNLIIPDLLIKDYARKNTEGHASQVGRLVEAGEEITNNITQERLPIVQPSEFGSYKLLGQSEQSFNAREKVINSPKYYNVAKLGKFYLQNPPTQVVDQYNSVLLFRGTLGEESRGQQHEFLEVVVGSDIHKILIDPQKHLSAYERQNFESLHRFEKGDFTNIEDRLRVYENLQYSYSHIVTIARNWIRYEDLVGYYIQKGEDPEEMWRQNRVTYLTACENFLTFTRANLGKVGSGTEHLHDQLYGIYKKLKNLQLSEIAKKDLNRYEKHEEESRAWELTKGRPDLEGLPGESWEERELRKFLADENELHPWEEERAARTMCDLVERINHIYQKKLFSQIKNPEKYKEEFRSEIRVSYETFDDDYFKRAESACEPGGYHKALCTSKANVRVVQVEQKAYDPAEILSIELEEQALQALHYNRNPERFVIAVYGGASFMESKELGRIDIPRDVFEYLNEREGKGNIICPGTQAGVGIPYAEMYVNYLRNYGHLPEHKRVFTMAMSPAPNIVFSGNKTTVDKFPGEQKFAMSPVPTIALDVPAGWHIWGEEREKIPYAKLSARTGDLIARASYNQDRIISLSNGGLFSILDTHETMRHNIPLLLHDQTGRAAEATAALVKNNMLPKTTDPETYWQQALEVIKDTMRPESKTHYLERDIGEGNTPANANQELYRKVYFSFLTDLAERQSKNPNFITIAQPTETKKVLAEISKRMQEEREQKKELAKNKNKK